MSNQYPIIQNVQPSDNSINYQRFAPGNVQSRIGSAIQSIYEPGQPEQTTYRYESRQPEQTTYRYESRQPEQTTYRYESRQPEQTTYRYESGQPEQTTYRYKSGQPERANDKRPSIEEMAQSVIRGDYGNGASRINAITGKGYDYQEVQDIINKILFGTNIGLLPSQPQQDINNYVGMSRNQLSQYSTPGKSVNKWTPPILL